MALSSPSSLCSIIGSNNFTRYPDIIPDTGKPVGGIESTFFSSGNR